MCMRFRFNDWYPNRWRWITRRATIHSVTLCACLSEPIAKIWMKIDPYYQQRNFSLWEYTGCADIRGGSLDKGIKWERCCQKLPFLLLAVAISFDVSNMRPKLSCMSMYSPSLAFHGHRNRWPGMTLNSHFALNTVSEWNRLAWMLWF